MKLSTQQVNAIVDTLELAHNKKEEEQEEKKKKEAKGKYKTKSQTILNELSNLSEITKHYLSEGNNDFFDYSYKNNKRVAKPNKITLSDIEDSLEMMEEDDYGSGQSFDTNEEKRKVVMMSIECKDMQELCKKLGIELPK